MTTNETVTITETAPDGTETVIEITTTNSDEILAEDEQTIVEEVIEALFDETADTETVEAVEVTPELSDTGFNQGFDDLESETEAVDATYENNPEDTSYPIPESDFTPVSDLDFAVEDTATPVYATAESNSETESTGTSEAEAAEAAELEAHAEAAREAQESADEFVAAGDYAAAAEAREVAENEAWEAGDQSILQGSDSVHLESAADKQEEAEYYEQQQAIHAQEGDYAAAREDASNAAYATGDADYLAGGDDHTGQAKAEEYQMDWAVWEENQADYYAQNAEEYAAEGDFENAEMYAAEAVDHQVAADHHGDLGEHGGEIAVYDASSEVDSGGSYASTYDAPDTDFSSE